MSVTHWHARYPGAPAFQRQTDAERDGRRHGVAKGSSQFWGRCIICYDDRCLTPQSEPHKQGVSRDSGDLRRKEPSGLIRPKPPGAYPQ